MSLDTETLSTLAGSLSATTGYLMSLPHALRQDAIEIVQRGLEEPEAAALKYHWPLYARDSQLPPEGDWDTWMILAGRGFGKTRTGAEWVRAQVETAGARRIALVARTLDEAQTVMIEGESGIIEISPPRNKPTYEPSKRKLTWPNGAHALAFSSHEPDQLRGPQFDAAWCDELASWQYPNESWDNLAFTLRLGPRPRSVVTTTPKAVELVRSLPNRPGVHVTRGSTYDNQGNLPPSFFNGLIDQYDGTRIGQQEIHAELIDEDEDALWKREWIEKARLGSYPPIARIVVSIDPAMSTRPTSSETGIVVVGADMRRQHAYVLADESGRLTPNSMALRVAHLFDKFNATQIVVEANAGRKPCRDHAEERDRAHPAHQGHPGTTRQANQGRTRRRPLRTRKSPPRRPLPRPRRPDVHLDPRRGTLPLPRPRRRPSPRRHPAHPKPQPHQLLVTNPKPNVPLVIPAKAGIQWGGGQRPNPLATLVDTHQSKPQTKTKKTPNPPSQDTNSD